MNSGNRPLAGVEIRATGAASSDSDQEGSSSCHLFLLSRRPVAAGRVYKKGLNGKPGEGGQLEPFVGCGAENRFGAYGND